MAIVTLDHKHCWEQSTGNRLFDICRERCCYCGEPNRSAATGSEDDDLG